ncbi:MAG: DoxX family protein [Methylotenera sp.]|nr:MAG: DoxX family protein [Methylotenera sp.]
MFKAEQCTKWTPYVLGILRIVTGFLFLQHGSAKLLGVPHLEMFGDGVPLMSLMGVAGILELVGGAMILIGLFTRPVAFILSGQMAVAYFMAHAPEGPLPILNNGELAALYSFIFLYFAFAGSGKLSVDSICCKKSV